MNLFTKQKWTHSLREWTSGCPREEGGKGIVSVGLMCAAAAKLLQSCPTLCDPIDGSPPGSSVPGILQARTLEWVAISFSTVLSRTFQRIPFHWVKAKVTNMDHHALHVLSPLNRPAQTLSLLSHLLVSPFWTVISRISASHLNVHGQMNR